MNPFMTLLRKDWRLNRVPLIGLAVLTIIGYSIVCLAYLWDVYDRTDHGTFRPAFLVDYLPPGAMMGMASAVLVAAAFGGVAFAQERREGWADFLAVMPATRARIIASKLIVGLTCLLAFCVLNVAMGSVCELFGPETHPQEIEDTLLTTLTAVTVFGFAWLLSTFMKSDTLAACAALIIVALSAALVSLACYHLDVAATETVLVAGAIVCTLATIIGGSAYYCRRVAP
jgi:ABC-type transport system involved in multi-copper enzyme maturation permease subunit